MPAGNSFIHSAEYLKSRYLMNTVHRTRPIDASVAETAEFASNLKGQAATAVVQIPNTIRVR